MNEEEETTIQQVCLAYYDIFFLESDNLTLNNEIKQSTTQNTKSLLPIYP